MLLAEGDRCGVAFLLGWDDGRPLEGKRGGYFFVTNESLPLFSGASPGTWMDPRKGDEGGGVPFVALLEKLSSPFFICI